MLSRRWGEVMIEHRLSTNEAAAFLLGMWIGKISPLPIIAVEDERLIETAIRHITEQDVDDVTAEEIADTCSKVLRFVIDLRKLSQRESNVSFPEST